jgi:hypothetical protein
MYLSVLLYFQDKVASITGASPDDEDEVLAGVGFGPNFYKQVTNGKGAGENYIYPHRKGALGDMPSTGEPTQQNYCTSTRE